MPHRIAQHRRRHAIHPFTDLDTALQLQGSTERNRPSRIHILAAEQQLHAASAGIGIAVANQYPSITLSGDLTRDAG
jgi:outer membrane protein TolC